MRKGTVIVQTAQEKAFLLAVAAKDSSGGWSAEDSIEELAQLASAAGANVVGKLIQRLPAPSPKSSKRQRKSGFAWRGT